MSVVRSTFLRELFRSASETSVIDGVVQAELTNGPRRGARITGGGGAVSIPNEDQVGVGFDGGQVNASITSVLGGSEGRPKW